MDNSRKKILLITGANGFIGRNLAVHFSGHGYEVRGLVRSPEQSGGTIPHERLFKGDLPDSIDPSAFENVETVVHCAYSTRHRSLTEARRDNEEGTSHIISLSRKARVMRLVFMSSLSAHEQAQSYYGKSKFALENQFDQSNDVIIRAGLVIGSGEAGVFSRMVAPLKAIPFVPLLDGGQQIIQPIHIDDLCRAVYSTLTKNISGIITVADPVGISLKEFLKQVSLRMRKKTIFLSVPSTPILYLIKVLEALHIPTPISSENILGLQHLHFVDTRNDLDRLGITLLPPSECLDEIYGSDPS